MAIRGYLERLRFSLDAGWSVDGWAIDDETPRDLQRVIVLHGSRVIGEVEPIMPRGDLPEGGRCFSLPIPPGCPIDYGPITLTLRIVSLNGLADIDTQLCADPIIGCVDQLQGAIVSGWACNVFDAAQPLGLDIILDGLCIDQIKAADRRWDLTPYGFGHCGFEWAMPQWVIDGKERSIAVRVTNGLTQIPSSINTVSAIWESLSAETQYWYTEQNAINEWITDARTRLDPISEGACFASPDLPQIYLMSRDRQVLFGSLPEPPAEGVKGEILGLLDGFVIGRIGPWNGAAPLTLDICVDGIVVAHVRAADRIDADGYYRFSWPAPQSWSDSRTARVSVRVANTSVDLPGAIDDVVIFAADHRARTRLREAQDLHRQLRNAGLISRVIAREGKRPRQSERLTAVDVLLDRIV